MHAACVCMLHVYGLGLLRLGTKDDGSRDEHRSPHAVTAGCGRADGTLGSRDEHRSAHVVGFCSRGVLKNVASLSRLGSRDAIRS